MLKKKIKLFFAAGLVAITFAGLNSCKNEKKAESVQQETKFPPVYSVSMNRICKEWDGQWQGITVASDGNCYFSSSTHSKSHGAGFHKFDPVTYKHTVLAEDMTEICGESSTLSQQGKIHSPIVECDGWL